MTELGVGRYSTSAQGVMVVRPGMRGRAPLSAACDRPIGVQGEGDRMLELLPLEANLAFSIVCMPLQIS